MHRKRWIVAPLTAVVLLLSLLVGASPASAALDRPQNCNWITGSFNACLNMVPNPGTYTTFVSAGFDKTMTQAQAQAAIDRGDQFTARLLTNNDLVVMDLPVRPGWPQAGPAGLGVEFGGGNESNAYLMRYATTNAFVVEITYYQFLVSTGDPDVRISKYRTGIIRGSLPVYTPPPTCITVCP